MNQPIQMWHFVRPSQEDNKWSGYLSEVLRQEGFMGFQNLDLDISPWPEINENDTVLLSRCWLRRSEIEKLVDIVAKGVHLIVLLPQRGLAEKIGLIPQSKVICPASISLQVGESTFQLQTHQPLAVHSFVENNWDIIVSACHSESDAKEAPAVVQRSLGKGKVSVFCYDVGAAIAAIRLGNPELASFETSPGCSWIHPTDMFRDHVHPEQALVPQASLHANLLSRVITETNSVPVPRIWYYPKAEFPTIGVFQSDDDYSSPEEFETLANAVEERKGCATFYLMSKTALSDDHVKNLRERGHSFGPHVHPRAYPEEMYYAIPKALEIESEDFKKRYGHISRTLQSHCAPWTGTDTHIRHHIERDFRLLFNYISLGENMWSRYLCGSTMPLRFSSSQGQVHDCWQQPVAIFDDESIRKRVNSNNDEVIGELERHLHDNLQTYHNPIVLLSHPVSYCAYSKPLIDHALNRLNDNDVPILNADQWLNYIEKRDVIKITQNQRGMKTHVIKVNHPKGPFSLFLSASREKNERVFVDNIEVRPTYYRRFGRDQLFIPLTSENESSTTSISIAYQGKGFPDANHVK